MMAGTLFLISLWSLVEIVVDPLLRRMAPPALWMRGPSTAMSSCGRRTWSAKNLRSDRSMSGHLASQP